MESAFAWIGQIADWVGQWIPRRVIIDLTEGAILYTGFFLPSWMRRFKEEMRITVCSTGIHWYWPARTTLAMYPIARQTDRLETQTMESKDGKTFLAGGTLTYRVKDLEL